MSDIILVGTTVEATTNVAINYFVLWRFQAVASENGATRFKCWSNASGYVKAGVYADSSGEPGSRLGYNDTQQAVVAGWNILTISSVDIVSGSYYWLGGCIGTAGCFRRNATGTYRYKSATFSSFVFPEPAGTGFTTGSYVGSVAVWGSLGWAHIAKVDGVASAAISKVNGVAVASISKICGVAV
jgi:hypothetical protein